MTATNEQKSAARRTFYRRLLDRCRARMIPRDDVADLLFAQQHYGTQDFFTDRHGQCHTIPMSQCPHYEFLKNHLNAPNGPHSYRDYLNAEWDYKFPGENSESRRESNIQNFIKLYQSVSSRANQYGPARAFLEPIRLCRRPDGRTLIIHGNHRAAVALRLGLDIPARYESSKRFLAKTAVKMVPKERFGDYKGQIPCQSLFLNDREIVRGRDRATADRLELIAPADIENRTVLELGCRIGSHCFLAAQRGAASVVGVDARPERISIAVRLNAYFSQPCYFVAADAGADHPKIKPADTVFCFDLLDSAADKHALAKTLIQIARRVLYIETAEKPDWPARFSLDRYFRTIDNLGDIAGPHEKTGRRTLYRCEIVSPDINETTPSGKIA
jgi:SAM-dependent methyltransferase